MDDDGPDPNRYATGLEATDIRSRMDAQRALIDAMHATQEQAKADLETLQRQMREAEAHFLLAKLRYTGAETYLQSMMGLYQSQLSVLAAQSQFFHPVRKAPLEILGMIFEYCIPCFDPFDRVFILSVTRQPFHLAAVCRRWRDACIATPRAWSRLTVPFDRIADGTLGNWEHMINCVIRRSSNSRLDISVTREKIPAQRGDRARLSSLLSEAMRRCRALRISFDRVHDEDYITEILCANAPDLVEVCMVALDEDLTSLPNHLMNKVLPASLSIKRIRCSREFVPTLSNLPLATNCTVEIPEELTTIVDLAHKAPKLTNLTLLWMDFDDLDTLPSLPRIEFANVRSLSLETHFIRQPHAALAEILKVPKLRQLTVNGKNCNSAERIIFIREITGSSPMRITHLTFSDLSMEDVDRFMDVVSSLGRLVSLRLDSTTFTQRGLQAYCLGLTRKKTDANWCNRNLTMIKFFGCTFNGCSEDDILSCVTRLFYGSVMPERPSKRRQPLRVFNIRHWPDKSTPSLNERVRAIFNPRQ